MGCYCKKTFLICSVTYSDVDPCGAASSHRETKPYDVHLLHPIPGVDQSLFRLLGCSRLWYLASDLSVDSVPQMLDRVEIGRHRRPWKHINVILC